jgi:ABC-type multidrug transport system fused ATPase/permease subunit
MIFRNIRNKLQEVSEGTKDYVESTLEYYKLRLFKVVSKLSISFLNLLIFGSLFLFILLFLSIGAALWLGTFFEEVYVGFLLIGGFYTLILIFGFIFGKRIMERKILGHFSDLFYDEEETKSPRQEVEQELDEFELLIKEEALRRKTR